MRSLFLISFYSDRNDILQKAIELYISYLSKNFKSNNSKRYRNARFLFTPKKEDTSTDKGYDDGYGEGTKVAESDENSQYSKLKELELHVVPPLDRWIPIRLDLKFYQNEEINNRGTERDATLYKKIIYKFQARNAKVIDDFMKECVDWYLEKLKDLRDDSRYLYVSGNTGCSNGRSGGGDSKGKGGKPGNEDEGGENNSTPLVYKRYKLADDKSFKTLFFKEKKPLLKLLDHFSLKTGKYAVPGYPHKLGLLLQ